MMASAHRGPFTNEQRLPPVAEFVNKFYDRNSFPLHHSMRICAHSGIRRRHPERQAVPGRSALRIKVDAVAAMISLGRETVRSECSPPGYTRVLNQSTSRLTISSDIRYLGPT